MSVFDLPSYVQNDYLGLMGQQIEVSLGACAAGLAISLPIGQACARWRHAYPPVLVFVTILYSIPSIAMFVFLVAYTHLTETTVFIPLVIYSLAILVPGVVDGIRAVPPEVRIAADAMGFGPARRYLQVELPIATPTIMAAVRVAAVSSISLMSVGGVLGNLGGFGNLFTQGLRHFEIRLVWLGLFSLLALALAVDLALRALQRLLTPWSARRSVRA
ncbi:MAG TPA: ABC transporter permease subunit [Actinocrinis sp.]|jgi:osmoprotectant transport system permease protein|uniref:ABC transporter permease n=1 Tax=Actinocrinis sp. TaxID=1920516 RepID=UPI002DDD0B53|nr:ABC transporter permease subunit [Actinocrinis sp.]HEV3169742.1 ABC transporter permease subunit [Actinocrinis sp.]